MRLFNDNTWTISLQDVLILALGSGLAILLGFVLAAMAEREKHGEGLFRTVFLDACNKLVLDSLAKDNFWVFNPFHVSDSGWINSIWNTMFTFQGDPDMTSDDVIEMLRDECDAVFG